MKLLQMNSAIIFLFCVAGFGGATVILSGKNIWEVVKC